jgi:hypothetical protein
MVSHPKHKLYHEKTRTKHYLDKDPWDIGKSQGIIKPETWKELHEL